MRPSYTTKLCHHTQLEHQERPAAKSAAATALKCTILTFARSAAGAAAAAVAVAAAGPVAAAAVAVCTAIDVLVDGTKVLGHLAGIQHL